MKSADIAAALVAGFQQNNNGNTDIGWHTGVVQTWDELTGLNSILINGNTFNNLSVLSTGAVTPLQAGDTVAVIRVQSQYFVIGKVRAAGAGAAERIASSRLASLQQITSSTFAPAPGPAGPSVSVYIGTAGRVLVIHSAEFICTGSTSDEFARSVIYQGVALSGANTAAAEEKVTDTYAKLPFAGEGSYSSTTLVTGLTAGITTFSCQYKSSVAAGLTTFVNNRVLTVMPI